MTLFHPRDWLRMYELHRLEKEMAKLQSYNVPIPPWLSNKVAELRADLGASS